MFDPWTAWKHYPHEHERDVQAGVELGGKVAVDGEKTVPRMGFLAIQEERKMPAGYVKMRDSFIRKGLSEPKAKEKAARIWNAKHPGNPVTRHEGKKARRKGKK